MNKQKSIFVTVLMSMLLASLNSALYIVARPVFFVFLGIFALIGFIGYAVAFCKWLEKPSERKEEPIDPPEVVHGEDVWDYSDIIDEVKREEAEK